MNGQEPQLVLGQDHHRLTADFYDALFVHSLLQHGMIEDISSSDARQSHKSVSRSEWHKFLDALCFLGDSKTGGKSVVALGVAQIAHRFVFYTTTNRKYEVDALDHLESVLQILQSVSIFEEASTVAAIRLARCSIERSTQRVHNYVCRLRTYITALSARSKTKRFGDGMLASRATQESLLLTFA